MRGIDVSICAGETGSAWPARGWIAIFAWTLLLAALARRAHHRDSARV